MEDNNQPNPFEEDFDGTDPDLDESQADYDAEETNAKEVQE